MCYFKRFSDDESDDENMIESVAMIEGFLAQNEGMNQPSDAESAEENVENSEPVAGPSNDLQFDSDWEPGDDDDDDDDDGDDTNEDDEEAEKLKDEKNNDNDDDEDEDEDPLVKALKSAKNRISHQPPEIEFKNHVTDLSFHPGEDIVAIASVTGDVFVYKYSVEQCELIQTLEVHSKACRVVEYGQEGTFLVTGGKEKSIMVTDTETSKLVQFYDDAHESAPYSLYILNENIFCSGDEGGVMKVWDVRQKTPVCDFKVGNEQISCIISNDAGRYVVCSSYDSITAYDMNYRKFYVQSEPYEHELTTMNLMKQGTKLAVGNVKGALYMFNWGQFGFHSDVYPGPKHNINSSLAITENILLTGCGDGNIRAASLFPHKQLGVVGQHAVSVEAMDISHSGEFIASVGFDETAKFWNISYFEDVKVKPEKAKKTDDQNNLPSSKVRNPGDFFADLS